MAYAWAMRNAGYGIAALAAAAAATLLGGHAEAHFALEEPLAANTQDSQGSPQKTAPCGPSDAGTPTGSVTTYQAGDTITVTIDEKIYHPGHYRVALAVNDPSELPAAPPVTPSMNDACASTVVQSPPVFPVLADGMLDHASPFGSPQSFQVTLPSDVTCTNCTLQVIQYMSSHGAPCFYYHCANIAIQDGPVMTTAASSSSGSTTTTTSSGSGAAGGSGGASSAAGSGSPFSPANSEVDEGCTCTAAGTRTGQHGGLALLGLGLLMTARRRKRSSVR
jgi:MYXO-CTERM domain-containing protein